METYSILGLHRDNGNNGKEHGNYYVVDFGHKAVRVRPST